MASNRPTQRDLLGRVKLASISSDYRLAQAPNPLDFHFDHVAWFQPSIPFSEFSGSLRIDPDTGGFFLNGGFTLGPAAASILPLSR
jgi:hypothetical protein